MKLIQISECYRNDYLSNNKMIQKRSKILMQIKQMSNIVNYAISKASDEQKESLKEWAIELLEIKNSKLSKSNKGKQIVSLMKDSDAIKSLLLLIIAELKKIGWDERSITERFTIGAVVAGATMSGSAGLAAFGGAIGLPLWIVFGAGGAFAGVIIEAASKKD